MFSESFVIKYKVKMCGCYTFVCLKYKGKFCDLYTAEFHMLEIVRQILWLLHQRFISLNVWKLYSAIFDYKVKFLNKIMCSINCGWLKESYDNMLLYSWVIDKYNTMFQMWRESFIRIKLILKFHRDCNFAGRFLIHLFFLRIFLLSFLVNLRIALYQKRLRLIHIKYNRIDRIIMAKMDYIENWNYILFRHAHLSLTLNLIN